MAGGRLVNGLDQHSGGLPIESGILPLLKHACLERTHLLR